MAAAAGKKASVSLSLFSEVNDLEVEEEEKPRRRGQMKFGLVNGIQSKKKHGESRSLRFRRGDR